MKTSIRALCLAVASTMAAIATSQVLPTAQASPGDPCPEVVIVALRGGSGETTIGETHYGDVSSDGWEGGATLSRLLGWTYFDSPEMADVPPVLGVDASYEAIDVPTGAATNTFERSIASGVNGAILTYDLFRKTIHPECAPQMILLGYSQGAAVARKVASAMESRGVVTAVMTVGDPMQKPDADGVFGSGSNGPGSGVGMAACKRAMTASTRSPASGVRRYAMIVIRSATSTPHRTLSSTNTKTISRVG